MSVLSAIDLSEYYSGGYFLIRADKPDWEQLKTDLLPDKLISLSTCFCQRVAVLWGWTPGDRDAALRFGIPPDKLDEFLDWCKTAHYTDIEFVSMFYSPEAARRFVERFLPDTRDLYLIGVGLHTSLAETEWHDPDPRKSQGVGIIKRIEQRLPLDEGGTPLGFEVLCFAYSDFADTWYCNFSAEELDTRFGIRPGQFGLLETREQAQRVYEWVNIEANRGEPYPYAYWLLMSYPLQAG